MEVQIKRSIVYMAKITPVFYQRKPKLAPVNNSEAKTHAEATVSSNRGYDSYRPTDDVEMKYSASNKKRGNRPEYKASYFGPRAWPDQAGSNQQINDLDELRGRTRSISRDRMLSRRRSATRGSTDRSLSRGSSSSMMHVGDKTPSSSSGREWDRRIKRARLE
jgi:hypothetical protein